MKVLDLEPALSEIARLNQLRWAEIERRREVDPDCDEDPWETMYREALQDVADHQGVDAIPRAHWPGKSSLRR